MNQNKLGFGLVLAVLSFYSNCVMSSSCEDVMRLPQEPQANERVRSLETALKNSDWYVLLTALTNPASSFFRLLEINLDSIRGQLVRLYFDGASSSVGYELLSSGQSSKNIIFALKKMIRKKGLRKQLNQIPLNNPDEILRFVAEVAEAIGEPAVDLLENVLLDSDVQEALKHSKLLRKSQLNLNWNPQSQEIAEFIIEIIIPFKRAVDRFKIKHPKFMSLQKKSEDRTFIAIVAPAVLSMALSPMIGVGLHLQLKPDMFEVDSQEVISYEVPQKSRLLVEPGYKLITNGKSTKIYNKSLEMSPKRNIKVKDDAKAVLNEER